MIRDRIGEHKSAIRLKKIDQSVASHFVEKGHGVQQLKFQVVDNVPKLRRGGDRNKELLKKRSMVHTLLRNHGAPWPKS
ncbi:hypothetical protein XELAEV_18001258mg [Xenopus laevis]|uniref:Uncharacterized protein n=1 Tax=Xenopus laevis TaxID=8355 RepID=A0A974BQ39_XENLA|nr:hypothetical protein XELAEV_18001258mg [Xenopus laevis]